MAGRGKSFELLDFTRFASPSVLRLDPEQTSIRLIERLGGKSFMTYNSVLSRMPAIVAGHVTAATVAAHRPYAEDWKNESLQAAEVLLVQHFGGRGRWYSYKVKPARAMGFSFKAGIKGIWYVDGRPHAVLINPRKGQRLSEESVRFLTRGIYELYCLPDPNDPAPLIVDLAEEKRNAGRSLGVYSIPIEQACTLEQFEAALRAFLKAVEMAGVVVPEDDAQISLLDALRRPGQ